MVAARKRKWEVGYRCLSRLCRRRPHSMCSFCSIVMRDVRQRLWCVWEWINGKQRLLASDTCIPVWRKSSSLCGVTDRGNGIDIWMYVSERKSQLKFLGSGERCVPTIKWFRFAHARCNCGEWFPNGKCKHLLHIWDFFFFGKESFSGCLDVQPVVFVLAFCVPLDQVFYVLDADPMVKRKLEPRSGHSTLFWC